MSMLRADQLLSRFGFCSRREASAWLHAGRLSAAGLTIDRPEKRIDPLSTLVDGKPLEFPEGMLLAYHKPTGVTCSHNPSEAPLIYDILPPAWMRRQPPPETIGRLDKETSGLILLTDNGAFVHRWSSPRHETAKTYEITVDADIPPDLVEIFASGTLLLDGESKPCRPATLTLTSPGTATVRLLEGRYHQVRRMFAAHNLTVVRLHRSGVGALTLDGIPEGAWREVQPIDIDGP